MSGRITAIAVAGALGALARYALGGWVGRRTGGGFPWGTLVVNISGSLALGFLFTLLTERFLPHPTIRTAATVGFLGAYTTFSTFTFETMRLIEDGAVAQAGANIALSVVAGLVAVYAGIVLGRAV
jgi:fluoride exporter